MPLALRATQTSHTAIVRASVELGWGLVGKAQGHCLRGSKGLGKGRRPRTQSPGGGLWYWSRRACPADLVDKCDISPLSSAFISPQ